MTDAVQVFPPGFRLVDSTGVPYSGAKLKFYAAGTTTLRTVYSTSDLSTTSLGSTVYTDSSGVPVASSGSSTEVMVYTGISAYKIVFTTSADVEIFTLDNIKGALDTSTFLTTGSTSTLTLPVAAKTGDYTIVAADRGKVIDADATGGTFTLTLTSAITLADNWFVIVRNAGTANPVKIAASQTIAGPWTSIGTATSFALRPGSGCLIVSNGATFLIPLMAPSYLNGTVGVIEITDRVSAAPSSPVPGARYIVSGAFSTYELHDIIEADGAGGFFEITPPTDCGWVAYVRDEDDYYSFQGSAWISLTAITTRHSGVAKAWGYVTVSGGTPTLAAGYNITSITDNGAGDFTMNFTTAMASANFAVTAAIDYSGSGRALTPIVTAKATGSVRIVVRQEDVLAGNNTSPVDNTGFAFSVFGAQ